MCARLFWRILAQVCTHQILSGVDKWLHIEQIPEVWSHEQDLKRMCMVHLEEKSTLWESWIKQNQNIRMTQLIWSSTESDTSQLRNSRHEPSLQIFWCLMLKFQITWTSKTGSHHHAFMHLPPSLFSKICCSIVQLVPEKSQDENFDKETHLDWPHWACAVAASSKGNESSNSWDIEKALKYWRKIRKCHILHLIHISYMMISSIWLIDDWYHVSLDEKNHWRPLIPSLPEAWPEQEVCMPGLPSMIPIPYASTSKGYEYQVYNMVRVSSMIQL